MARILNLIKVSLKSPAIFYLISRYGTYIIQFINSLLIAAFLGPYYLGIWGFIYLVIGYVGQVNLGIPHSLNVILSIKKKNKELSTHILQNGVTMTLILSILTILFFVSIKLNLIQVGVKYQFSNYAWTVALIAILTHFNSVLSNVFRVYGKITAIAINQSLYPLFVLIIVFLFRGENLLWAILFANCLAFIVSFIIYIFQTPVNLTPLFNSKIVRIIQIKGWYLFLYNASFYLILLSTKSFISSHYSIVEFGYFTFAYSLANVVSLLLNSVSFLIYPKMLNRFATTDGKQTISILTDIRTAYISTSHLLIHLLIVLFPLFLYFFPNYSDASTSFKITALTVVLYTNSFGYQGLLLAKGREKKVASIALGALIVNVLLAMLLIYILAVSFDYVILATLLTYLLYVYLLGFWGRKVLKLSTKVEEVLKDIFPIKQSIPFVLSLCLLFFGASNVYFVLPFLVYLFLNYKDIIVIKNTIKKIISNPNFINI